MYTWPILYDFIRFYEGVNGTFRHCEFIVPNYGLDACYIRTSNSQLSDLWAHCPYSCSYSASFFNMHVNHKSAR